jgi:uncharacterized protein YecE (DUF72 family)
MGFYVGTSSYSEKAWKGKFYPKDLPAAQMLHYYGAHFRAVEINSTFFAMPKASVLEKWANEVPAGFRFAIKAPRAITHLQWLKNKDDLLSTLLEVVGTLRDRLGPLLFQLPAAATKDVPRLRAFLGLLPPLQRVAFEFRHPSWFDEEVFGLLRDHRVALCIADTDDDLEVPLVATADWGYLRLRRLDYDDAALQTWLQWIQEQDWRDAFVFFKHEVQGNGPRLAQRLIDLAGAVDHQSP